MPLSKSFSRRYNRSKKSNALIKARNQILRHAAKKYASRLLLKRRLATEQELKYIDTIWSNETVQLASSWYCLTEPIVQDVEAQDSKIGLQVRLKSIQLRLSFTCAQAPNSFQPLRVRLTIFQWRPLNHSSGGGIPSSAQLYELATTPNKITSDFNWDRKDLTRTIMYDKIIKLTRDSNITWAHLIDLKVPLKYVKKTLNFTKDWAFTTVGNDQIYLTAVMYSDYSTDDDSVKMWGYARVFYSDS